MTAIPNMHSNLFQLTMNFSQNNRTETRWKRTLQKGEKVDLSRFSLDEYTETLDMAPQNIVTFDSRAANYNKLRCIKMLRAVGGSTWSLSTAKEYIEAHDGARFNFYVYDDFYVQFPNCQY